MEWMPPRIALLGATGFVGGAVLRQIKMSQASTRCEAHLLVHETPLENVPAFTTVHRGSLVNIPQDLLPQAPHVVLHCASKQIDRDGTGFDINLQGIDSLLRAVSSHTRAIIFVSSYSVYGDDAQRDIDETAPLRPQSALARSRAECEARLAEFARSSHCRVIICRPRFVLGAADRFVLPGIARLVRAGLKIGNGQQRFSVIDVNDLARVLLALAQQAMSASASLAACEVYNVGYAKPVSLNDIYAALTDSMPVKKPRWHIPVNDMLLRCVEFLPLHGARQLVQRLRLIGYDHYGNVNKLHRQLGNNWLQSDSRDVVRRIVASTTSFMDNR